jgi:hypothetical protein
MTEDDDLNISDSVLYNSPITINITKVDGSKKDIKKLSEEEIEKTAEYYRKLAKVQLIGEQDIPWVRENLELPPVDVGKPLIDRVKHLPNININRTELMEKLWEAKDTSIITMRKDQKVDFLYPKVPNPYYLSARGWRLVRYTTIVGIVTTIFGIFLGPKVTEIVTVVVRAAGL